PGVGRPHGPSGRRLGHPRRVDPRQALPPAGRDPLSPGPRGRDDDRPRAADEPVRRRCGRGDRPVNGVTWLVLSFAAALVGGGLGWFLNNRLGGSSLEAARLKGDEIQRGAVREAENVKRQQTMEAREQILRDKSKAEGDLRSRKGQ